MENGLVIGLESRVISARWIVPVDGPPLSMGTLTVEGGRIRAIEPAGERTPDERYPDAVLIPGLVNAHTHLDLSHLHRRTPPILPLTRWLKQVIDGRLATDSTPPESIARGLQEALGYGTTLIADIAGQGLSWGALAEAPIWAVCFREILGLKSQRAEAAWKEAITWLQTRPDEATVQAALSPHAPYSTNRAIIEAAARVVPVCIHLAETADEQQLLEQRTGDFVTFMRDLGVWEPQGLAPNWDWITWRCSRAPYALFAHGNYLPPHVQLPANGTLVYCPRTHAAFGHSPYPLRAFLQAGHRVALGTDSLASNPDLDILAEARYVHATYPDIAPETILRLATLNGAQAMQMDHLTGSLTVGKSADAVLVPVTQEDAAQPYELLLKAPLPAGRRRTLWQGTWRD